MAYTPTEWKNGVTPINETNLNKMETGISKAHEAISEMQTEMVETAEELHEADLAIAQRFNKAPNGAEAGQVIMIDEINQLGLVKWKAVEHYHMRKESVVTWGGVTTGLSFITINVNGFGMQYVKISDTPLTEDELIGSTTKFVSTSGEEVTEKVSDTKITKEGNAIFYGDVLVSALEDITSDIIGNIENRDITFTTGLWHLHPTTAGGYIYEILGEVPVKIPEKFLPKMSSLPDVTADDNGKFLQVVGGKWVAVAITNGNEVAY